jgi:RNA polymerase sigma factor (sigma-70 family)
LVPTVLRGKRVACPWGIHTLLTLYSQLLYAFPRWSVGTRGGLWSVGTRGGRWNVGMRGIYLGCGNFRLFLQKVFPKPLRVSSNTDESARGGVIKIRINKKTEAGLDCENSDMDDQSSSGEGGEETRDALVSRVFREHNQALIRFLRARLPSVQDAEEVAQEAYVRMLRLDETDTISHLQAYLFRIAANIAIDRNRQQKRKPDEEEGSKLWDVLPSSYPLPDDALHSTEKLARLQQIVAELPPKCRMAFMLYKFKELSYEEIATRMQLSESMIRKYVLKAIIFCRDKLEE